MQLIHLSICFDHRLSCPCLDGFGLQESSVVQWLLSTVGSFGIVVDLLVLMNSPTWSFLAGAVQPLLDFVVADSIGLPRYARKAWRPE